jgi:hypothetical protein
MGNWNKYGISQFHKSRTIQPPTAIQTKMINIAAKTKYQAFIIFKFFNLSVASLLENETKKI